MLRAEFDVQLFNFRKEFFHVAFGNFNDYPGSFLFSVHKLMQLHAVNNQDILRLQDIFLFLHENRGISFQNIDQFQGPVIMRGPVLIQVGIG